MAVRIEENDNADAKVQREAVSRLQRIEGQVRGLCRLIQSNGYNENILNQFASIKSALNSARNFLLKEHIRNSLADRFTKDHIASTEELLDIFRKVST